MVKNKNGNWKGVKSVESMREREKKRKEAKALDFAKTVMKFTNITEWNNGRYRTEVIPDISTIPSVNTKQIVGRKKNGRPTKYKTSYPREMIEYFQRPYFRVRRLIDTKNNESVLVEKEINYLPLFEGFAAKIGVVIDTLLEWRKVYPNFSDAYTTCKALQKQMLIDLSSQGYYNPNFARLMAVNLTDMQDISRKEISAPQGKPLFDLTNIPEEKLAELKKILEAFKNNND